MRGSNGQPIHSTAMFRRYVDAVREHGLRFDVAIIGGVAKPQVAYAISLNGMSWKWEMGK